MKNEIGLGSAATASCPGEFAREHIRPSDMAAKEKSNNRLGLVSIALRKHISSHPVSVPAAGSSNSSLIVFHELEQNITTAATVCTRKVPSGTPHRRSKSRQHLAIESRRTVSALNYSGEA
jgi:hypothetical protein